MRVVVATDRSSTAEAAVAWAAQLAEHEQGELVLRADRAPRRQRRRHRDRGRGAAGAAWANGRASSRASAAAAIVQVSDEPASAIVEAAAAQAADVLVVGNAGMQGRKEFLLGNVPNRVSHAARCTVVIVNTTTPTRRRRAGRGASVGRRAGDAAARGPRRQRARTVRPRESPASDSPPRGRG